MFDEEVRRVGKKDLLEVGGVVWHALLLEQCGLHPTRGFVAGADLVSFCTLYLL